MDTNTQTSDLAPSWTAPVRRAPRVAAVLTDKPGVISRRLEQLIKERGLSLAQLARRAKVSPSTIGRMINVFEPPANHPLLERIAEALRVPLRELTAGGKTVEFTKAQYVLLHTRKRRHSPRPYRRASTNGPRPERSRSPEANFQTTLQKVIQAVNVARMTNEGAVTLPVGQVSDLLENYLKASGLPTNVVIGQSFEEVFR